MHAECCWIITRGKMMTKDEEFMQEARLAFGITKEWQGLTEDEQDKLYADWERGSWNYNTFANAIEQALKEKNT